MRYLRTKTRLITPALGRQLLRSRPWRIAPILCAVHLVLACKDLTKVSAPDLTQPGQIENASGALNLRAGAIGSMANSTSAQVLYSGLIADELANITGPAQGEDQRLPLQESSFPWDALSTTRNAALTAIPYMQTYAAKPSWRIAELFAIAGYTELAFAEDMCNGIPLATISAAGADPGPGFTRPQLLARAIVDFDSASTYAIDSDSIMNLTRIGRARALLDGQSPGPAALVADSVPITFAHQLQYDGNAVVNASGSAFTSQYVSVSEKEGGNGLDFISAADPRVVITNTGTASTGDSVYVFTPQSALSASLTLASGVEARLIIAESLLPINGSAGSAWRDSLNALRTDGTFSVSPSGDTLYDAGEGGIPGLRPLSDPGSDNARVSLLFRERAFWLFLTGHRQGDLRRLVREYGRSRESVFPTGSYRKGGTYGSATTFNPYGEGTNTQYSGCVDHDP